MAVADMVNRILAILLDYLSLAIVIVLIYMLFQLVTGGQGIGDIFKGGHSDRRGNEGNGGRGNGREGGNGRDEEERGRPQRRPPRPTMLPPVPGPRNPHAPIRVRVGP